MLVILFSLIPLVCWGTADYIASKLSRKLSPFTINLFFSLGGLLVSFVVALILGFPEITIVGILRYIGVSLAVTSGFLCMVKAFSVGATGVVAPIANSYAVLTALISVIFLDSVLTLTGALAIVVIIGGIALLTYKKDPNHNKRDFERSVRYSLLALLLFGVGFALFDVASTQEWYQNNLLFQLVGIFVASTLFVIATKAKSIDVIKGTVKTPLLYVGSIIGGMGAVGLFLAIAQADNVAIPAAVGAAAPLMTAFLAYKFDGEHLTGLQRFASVIIVLGIIMLSI